MLALLNVFVNALSKVYPLDKGEDSWHNWLELVRKAAEEIGIPEQQLLFLIQQEMQNGKN